MKKLVCNVPWGKAKTSRFALFDALVLAAAALTLTAGAVTKTYSQYGFTEVPNIAMDGIPSSTEIGATPQLAFPGVTLDDIHGHQFITELYGGGASNRTFRVVTEDGVSTVYMSRVNGFMIFVK